jgi:hypothetical protein
MVATSDNSVDVAILAARIDEGTQQSSIVGPEGAQAATKAGLTTANFRDDLGPAAEFSRPGPAFKLANLTEDTLDNNPVYENNI